MKQNFLQLATEAQKDLEREYKVLDEATQALVVSRQEVAKKASDLLAKEQRLNDRERSQDLREEEVVAKEGRIRNLEQARVDRESAELERKAAEKALLKATNLELENKQKEENLYKREVALSEAKKTYMDELKKEFVNSIVGRVI